MRVALVPTGRTEWTGMPAALARLFPAHTFYPVPTPDEVASHPERFPYSGFTTNPLGALHEQDPLESAIDLGSSGGGRGSLTSRPPKPPARAG
jgi:hypothetical protein